MTTISNNGFWIRMVENVSDFIERISLELPYSTNFIVHAWMKRKINRNEWWFMVLRQWTCYSNSFWISRSSVSWRLSWNGIVIVSDEWKESRNFHEYSLTSPTFPCHFLHSLTVTCFSIQFLLIQNTKCNGLSY